MKQEELDKIYDEIEEVWGDWESTFDVMIQNNLHFEGNTICNSDDTVVYEDIVEGIYPDDILELIVKYFELYHKPTLTHKPKYMKLC